MADALTAVGHDVLYMRMAARGAPDDDLIIMAETEDRIVLTYDYDLPEAAVRWGALPMGLVLVAASVPYQSRVERVVTLLASDEFRLGSLFIIERKRVRSRPLIGARDH